MKRRTRIQIIRVSGTTLALVLAPHVSLSAGTCANVPAKVRDAVVSRSLNTFPSAGVAPKKNKHKKIVKTDVIGQEEK